MSDWVTPDEVKEHHDNGYEAGVVHERERIIALLETKCKPNDHDYINGCNCDVITIIKGEN